MQRSASATPFTVEDSENSEELEDPQAPAADAFVTSGIIGSRDTVLVFRAKFLLPKGKKSPPNAEGSDEDEDEVVPSSSRRVQNANQPKNARKPSKPGKPQLRKVNLNKKPNNNDSDSDDENSEFVRASDNVLIEANSDAVYSPDMPAVQLKLSYKFAQGETKLLRFIFNRHGLTETKTGDNFSILWGGVSLKPSTVRMLKPYQRVNHFPTSVELTRKDKIYQLIVGMQKLHGFQHFDIVPQSFLLPDEYNDLLRVHEEYKEPWIVKPTASTRGIGIYLVSDPEQIFKDEVVLVSKYVTNPFCINGHKCDLRLYILVTSFDPLIIYLYEEGLVRLATIKYELKPENLWNPCVHLCNYSINKFHADYVQSNDAKNESFGHKWTLSAFLKHLRSKKYDTKELMLNIEDVIIKALLSCSQSIVAGCRAHMSSKNNCFELYGFDILIDNNFKPWLIEINVAPSMAVESRVDSKVKSCLITDALTCVGIPALDIKTRGEYDTLWTRYRSFSDPNPPNIPADTTKNNHNSGTRRLTGSLTLEETRIVRNARLQNARRGGFVRIFPTADTMRRYGKFLDETTGIGLSERLVQGRSVYNMAVPHNYNRLLFRNLYGNGNSNKGAKEGNSLNERMHQYERALPSEISALYTEKPVLPENIDEATRLRKEIVKQFGRNRDLSVLQSRRAFSSYLVAVAERINSEGSKRHEKLIQKFLNNATAIVNGRFEVPENLRDVNRTQTETVLQLLENFLVFYDKDTAGHHDSFDHIGMITRALFNDFLAHAKERDLATILTLQTNVTGRMTYLYNWRRADVPPAPPIPCGAHGFLKALPNMLRSVDETNRVNDTARKTKKKSHR